MSTNRPAALYVEDNALDADLTRRTLLGAHPPIEVDIVTTIAAAMQRLDRDPARYTWVMVDLSLPDGDGLQVLRRVRQLHLQMAVIAVSGTGTEASVFRALKSGADDYVIKNGDYLRSLPDTLRATHERLRARAEQIAAPPRVLYIEDSAMDSELARRHLRAARAPSAVRCARSPRSAGDGSAARRNLRCAAAGLPARSSRRLRSRQARAPRGAARVADHRRHRVRQRGRRAAGLAPGRRRLCRQERRPPGQAADGARQRDRACAPGARARAPARERGQAAPADRAGAWRHHGHPPRRRRRPRALCQPTARGRARRDAGGSVRRNLAERVDPADRATLLEAIDQVVTTGQGRGCEFRIEVPGKGRCWIEWQLSAEAQPDGAVLVYGYLFDTTERHRMHQLAVAARAAEQANRAKTEFLSRMSHELRTPLNAVVGFAQLLARDPRDPLTETQRRWLDHIQNAAQHLVAMIGEVLDLSRIEADQVSIRLEAIDLLEACDDALKLSLPANERQVEVRIEPPGDGLPCVVLADRLRLVQVLSNLLSNAIKYNRVGGTVSVRVEREDDLLAIDIADTGIGLSDVQLGHLFEPFNRLGAEGSSITGTGIGLVIVKRLVELMAGTLTVASRVGVGSHFTVRLPLAAGGPGSPMPSPAEPSAVYGLRGHVLYIEDSAVNIELVRCAAETLTDIELRVATTGAEGLRAAIQRPPHLVLLDMHLPDMDGFEVFRALRQHPALADVPCVALSADALPEQIERTLQAGFDGYLTKPIDLQQLVGVMLQWLRRRTGG